MTAASVTPSRRVADARALGVELRLRAERARAGRAVSTEGLPPEVAAVLHLAMVVGAPVVEVLDRAAGVATDRADVADEARVAAAQATSVARLLVAVPVVAVPVSAVLLDLPVLAFHATPAGRVVVALSGAALGLAWTCARLLRRRVDRAVAAVPTVVPALELVAVAASAGLPMTAALRAAASAVDERVARSLRAVAMAAELGVDPPRLPGDLAVLAELVDDHGRVGLAVVDLLRRHADACRAEHRRAVREQAQRLGAQLVVPTALLVLPATVALVVAPLLASALAVVA